MSPNATNAMRMRDLYRSGRQVSKLRELLSFLEYITFVAATIIITSQTYVTELIRSDGGPQCLRAGPQSMASRC